MTSIVVTESLNLINSGTVTGIGGALSVGGTLTLTNSGVIDALENAVSAGGLLDMRNTGTVAGGVSALAGDDIVRNHGLIDDVDLGDGSNIVQNLGRIGSVIFGTGKDLYQGRRSQAGADVDGGDGKDTIRGGAHDDSFAGGAGADILRGRSGDDALAGGDGNDLIRGGGGGDEITGGVGRDNLGGGAGADTFIYTSANDGKGKTGDRLHGFDRAEDVIDVSGLGALNFIGHHGFGNNAGELRITTGGGKAVAHIDLTGNGHDDVTIKVLDVGNLSAADFVL